MTGSRVRRIGLRIAAAFMLIMAGMIAWGYLASWGRLPEFTPAAAIDLPVALMTNEAYGAVFDTHARPYVVQIDTDGRGAVLLYGATHTKEPGDPQIGDIRRRWEVFRPTVALCESRLGVLFPGLMDPVRTFGEPGAVHAMARLDGIATYTWEPPVDVQIRELLAHGFTREEVAMSVMLRPYFSNRRFGLPPNPEAVVAEAVRKRSCWPGIEGVFDDVDNLDAAWSRHFADGPDWRDVSDEFGLPGFLGRMDANRVRDEHFARVIIDLVRRGERVFAVAGSSHAVKLDRPLRAALTGGPRP